MEIIHSNKGAKKQKKKKSFDLSHQSSFYIKYRILIVKTRAATYCYVALPFTVC